MKRLLPSLLVLCLLLTAAIHEATAQDNETKIENALSAAPASIAEDATVLDWPAEPGGEMPVLKEGSNAWTCLPAMPATSGNDPMCLDDPWLEWADAFMNKKDFSAPRMGFGYMLRGGSPESNTDPYAEGPTPDNEWLDEGVPHLMIIVPDESMLEGLPVTPDGGGPWVMWRGTPYVHIMAPMPEYDMTGM